MASPKRLGKIIEEEGIKEIALYCLVSKQIVWKWRRGLAKPEPSKLLLIAVSLNRTNEINDLALEAGYEPKSIWDSYQRLFVYPDIQENPRAYLERVHKARIGGNPERAMEVVDAVASNLIRVVEATPERRSYLARSVGLILNERATVYREVGKPFGSYGLSGETNPLSDQMLGLSKIYGDQNSGLALNILGDSLKIQDRHRDAIPMLQEALNYIEDPDLQLDVIRSILMSANRFDNKTAFTKAEQIADRLIQDKNWTKPEEVAQLYQGWGESVGISARNEKEVGKSNYLLQQAEDVLAGCKAPLRNLQLSISRFRVHEKHNPNDVVSLEKMLQEIYRWKNYFGTYPRHGQAYQKFVRRLGG